MQVLLAPSAESSSGVVELLSIKVCGRVLPGRDDQPADCIIFFSFPDVFRVSTMVVMENVGQQKLKQMVSFCQNMDR